jgi:hypothetical protein
MFDDILRQRSVIGLSSVCHRWATCLVNGLSTARFWVILACFSGLNRFCPQRFVGREDVRLKSAVLPQSDVTDIRVIGAPNSNSLRRDPVSYLRPN